MRSDAKAVLLFLLCLVPVVAQAARCTTCEEPTEGPGAQAHPAIDNHRVDPAAKKIETSFTNGLSVVVDARLGQVIFTKGSARTSVTIDEAFMRLANGDRKLADGYIAETLAMLEDPSNVLQLSRAAQSTPNSVGAQMAHKGMPAFSCQFTGYCYYVPRFMDIGGPANRSTYGFGYVDMHRLSPPPHSVDYTIWSKFRDAACADARDHGAQASIATGMMMFGCAAAITGAGLGACGISGLAVAYSSNQMVTAGKRCAASYPGPGNW